MKSRAFGGIAGLSAAGGLNPNGNCMLPLGDMLNHATGSASLQVFGSGGNVGFFSPIKIAQGDRVTVSYGDHPMDEKLLSYGFSTPRDKVLEGEQLIMQLAATRAAGGDSSPVIELYERARCHDMIVRTREAHDVLEDYLLPCMRLLHLPIAAAETVLTVVVGAVPLVSQQALMVTAAMGKPLQDPDAEAAVLNALQAHHAGFLNQDTVWRKAHSEWVGKASASQRALVGVRDAERAHHARMFLAIEDKRINLPPPREGAGHGYSTTE